MMKLKMIINLLLNRSVMYKMSVDGECEPMTPGAVIVGNKFIL